MSEEVGVWVQSSRGSRLWHFEKGAERKCVRRADTFGVCVPGRCFYVHQFERSLGPRARLMCEVCELADGEELRGVCRRLLAGGWLRSAAELLAVAAMLAGEPVDAGPASGEPSVGRRQ